MNGCIQEALFRTAVKALAVVLAGNSFALRNFACDRVRQLDFSAGAAVNLAQTVENFGFKNIASDHGHRRRSNLRIRFFNNGADRRALLVLTVDFNNTVLLCQFTRNGLYSQYVAAVILFTSLDQLCNRRLFSIDQVVSQQNGKRLFSDDRLGAQDCVAQSKRFRLTDKNEINSGRHNCFQSRQKSIFVFAL